MIGVRHSTALWLIAMIASVNVAWGESVEELKRAVDVRGLAVKLGHKAPAVRLQS